MASSSSFAPPRRTITAQSSLVIVTTTVFLLINVSTQTSALAFQLPKIRFPWDNTSPPPQPSPTASTTSALQPNDKVLVIGGTGGVGQLVTKKLRSRPNANYGVRVAARDVSRAIETIDDEDVDVVPLNLVGDNVDEEETIENLKTALNGAKGVVISLGTTAFPTKKWSGGNTPKAIDEIAVSKVAKAAAECDSVKRVVLLTSVGVDRTKEMPFLILNLFGVLDAKRAGEQAVMDASGEGENFDYAIVRPGRLVGGPYTNLDLAKLMQVEGGAENGLTVELGDQGLGDCKRDACAEAVVQCLERVECQNLDFSIVSNEEMALTDEQWSTTFAGLKESE